MTLGMKRIGQRGCQTGLGLVLSMLSLGVFAGPAPSYPQASESCTASLLNRTTRMDVDGSFELLDIPVEQGLHRVRVACTPEGAPVTEGQSALFSVAGAPVTIPPIVFGDVDPIPVALEVSATTTRLERYGEVSQLAVFGILADGTLVDMRLRDTGTDYATSSGRILEVCGFPSGTDVFSNGVDCVDGELMAVSRGTAIVSVRHEGVTAAVRIEVAIPNDADEDGMTDEFELANGLDPENPDDAFEDPDGDGLTNLEEFEIGTNIYQADSDADGLTDSEEVALGTLPTDPDTDGDGLLDALEIALVTNPFNPDTDGDQIEDGAEVDIGIDPLVPNLTTTVIGYVVDRDGLGVEGASVVAFARLVTTTGFGGEFRLAHVPADQGDLVIFSRMIRDAEVLDGSSAPTAPVPGEETDVGVIELAAVSGRVSGLVLDTNGDPVPDARVTILTGIDRRQVNADITGFYSFEALPPGPFEVQGFDPRSALRGRAFDTLPADSSVLVDIELGASGTVLGRVFERDAATAAGAGVAVEAKFDGKSSVVEATQTDLEGRYFLDFLPLGVYDVDATRGDERGRAEPVLTFTSEVIESDVTFLGKGRVTGTVEAANGDRFPGLTVKVSSVGPFEQVLETVSDEDGEFAIDGVFVGEFVASVTDVFNGKAAVATGEILFDGHSDQVALVMSGVGNIVGTVFESDGVTVAPGVEVSIPALGRSTTTGPAGDYRIDTVPFSVRDTEWTTRYLNPANEDCATAVVRVTQPDVDVQEDVTLEGFGGLDVVVRYPDGSPVVGAQVVAEPRAACGGSRSAPTDELGVASFANMHRETFDLVVVEPVCGERVGIVADVPLDATNTAVVTVSGFGSIGGTVFAQDGVTPQPAVVVGRSGTKTTVLTDPNGVFHFACVPLDTYSVDVRGPSLETLAKEFGVEVTQHLEHVVQDLTVTARGTVEGTVLDTDGAPAPGIPVRVNSAGSFSRIGYTDINGYYRVEGVPTATVEAVARDSAGLSGRGEGVLVSEGEVIQIDIQLEGVLVVADLYDANNYRYPVEYPNGNLLQGTLGVFRGDDEENTGGFLLELGQSGTYEDFVADASAISGDGRETYLTGSSSFGLQVERRTLVPVDGYFARYLEILTNPTGSPLTVDVAVESYFRFVTSVAGGGVIESGTPGVRSTSSGDDLLETGGATPDRWAVIDVDLPAGSALRELYPSTAFVFDGEAAPVAVVAATLELTPQTFIDSYGRLRTEWRALTVPAGETVILMHFGSQETGSLSAQAAAERLATLPPEALTGLTTFEIDRIVNFSVPADGVGTTPPLPELDGEVSGTVFEGDVTTPVPGAEVTLLSTHPIFQRKLEAVASSPDAAFEFKTEFNPLGQSKVIPREDVTLQAEHPLTFIVSPATGGSFSAGSHLVSQDVVFSGSGRIFGAVRRANGEVVSSGEVALRGVEQLITLFQPLSVDGSFSFHGLPSDTYSITATEPHPQGTELRASATAVLTGAEEVLADVYMPPAGGVEGTVRAGAGYPLVGLGVELLGADGFERFTQTDTGGRFSFLDAPVGSYDLYSVEPATGLAVRLSVVISADQVLTQDLTFTGTGSVDVSVTFSDGSPVAESRVTVRKDPLGNFFLSAGKTATDGTLRIENVPVGTFAIRAVHPDNPNIATIEVGEIMAPDETVSIGLSLEIDDPPSASILQPVNGAAFPEGTLVQVVVDAVDDVGIDEVALLVDGLSVGVDPREPFEFGVPLVMPASGNQIELRAVALDNGGNSAESLPVLVQVLADSTPPQVSINSPTAGASFVEGTSISVGTNVSDNVRVTRVDFSLDGVVVATQAFPGPLNAVVTLPSDAAPVDPVIMELAATAYDPAGNSATATVSIEVQPDQPPTINLVSAPPDGAQVQEGDVVSFSAAANDDVVGVAVELRVDGVVQKTLWTPPFAFDLTIPDIEGANDTLTVVLRARDTQGQFVETEPVHLAVSADSPPVVSILLPVAGAEFVEGSSISIQADAADDKGVTSVEFWIDGVREAALFSSPYAADVQLGAGADGTPVQIDVVATDTYGQTTTGSIQIVRRDDTVGPSVSLTTPSDGAVITVGPSDVVIVIDRSDTTAELTNVDVDGDGSNDSVLEVEIYAAKELLSFLDPSTANVGLVVSPQAGLGNQLTNDFAAVDAALDAVLSIPPGQPADIAGGAQWASDELTSLRARRGATPIAMLLAHSSLGEVNGAPLAEAGVVVNVFGVSVTSGQPWLEQLALDTGGVYTDVVDPADLVDALQAAASFGLESLAVRADASDDVAVKEVRFGVNSADFSIDEIEVDPIEPYSVAFGLSTLTETVELTATATSLDFGDNQSAASSAVVTVHPSANEPELVRLEPDFGTPGETIEIVGRFLAPLEGSSTVSFDGVEVVPVALSKIRLTVDVPAGVATGPLTLVTDGQASNALIFRLDSDGDDLPDDEEAALGTDPNNPDTDGDGLTDGLEAHGLCTEPTLPDSDSDGMSDGFEVQYGLLPCDPADAALDPDNDGLSNLGESAAGTDPGNPDTDGDGLLDGYEVDHGLDPNVDDAAQDADSDGLTNAEEAALGTHPTNPDTDGDGLSDGDEVNTHLTNPLLPDHDGDGLSDGDEVNVHGTEPLVADTDAGGRTDGEEVLFDFTDPNDPADDLAPVRVSNIDGEFVTVASAVDEDGHLHVVWSDPSTVFYSMLRGDGTPLIDDTELPSGGEEGDEGGGTVSWPDVAIAPGGELHAVWVQGFGQAAHVRYAKILPFLDDQDGSAGDTAAIVPDGSRPVASVWRPDSEGGAAVAVDSLNRVHIVSPDQFVSGLIYLQLDAEGTTVVPPTAFGVLGGCGTGPLPGVAVVADANNNVHVTWKQTDAVCEGDIRYVLLDGASGALLIAPTTVGPGEPPEIGVLPAGRVAVVFTESSGSSPMVVHLDPALDDQNGDAADPVTIIAQPATALGPGETVSLVGAAVDELGWTHVAAKDEDKQLFFVAVDENGEEKLAWQPVRGEYPFQEVEGGSVSARGGTAFLTWAGGADLVNDILFRYVNGDPDGDGLNALDEIAANTESENPDTDADAAGDGFEVAFGLLPLDPSDGPLDPDSDGLTNAEEDPAGSDPTRLDTDGDLLGDGDEVNIHLTDPASPDTDGDGLNDYEELNTYLTDPASPDTDGDGARDGFEVAFDLLALDPSDGVSDPDGDGLTNAQEDAAGSDPTDTDSDGDLLEDGDEVNTYLTDPANWDTDRDGLGDESEINTYLCDPLVWDTDGDYLNDGDEANIHLTDPADPDTDAGGRTDGEEVLIDGTDPHNGTDDVSPP